MVPVFILLIFNSNAFLYADENHRHILYISSYHPGFPTFNQQIAGIKSVFNTSGDIVDIEFMDTKRFPSVEIINEFNKLLSWKLRHLPSYDAIIVADDAALKYAVREKDNLFRDIPIFFCGINDIKTAGELNNGRRMRGVIEAVSIKGTLDVIRQLFPGREKLVVITDSTMPGQADLKSLMTIAKYMPFTIEVLSLQNLTFDELHNSVSRLDDRASILLLSLYTDVTGETRLFNEELAEIISRSKVPVFHLWEHGLGDGIIGGKLISHEDQGREAAKITLLNLQGTPLDKLSIPEQSPNRYKFDYNVLKKFQVSLSALPGESIVINRPESFFKVHRTAIITTSFIIILLCYSIITLLIHRKRLQKQIEESTSELKSREQQLKMALDNAQQITWEWDAATNLITISRDLDADNKPENPGLIIEWNEFLKKFHHDDIKETISFLTAHLKGVTPIYENIHRRILSDGSIKWLLARGKVTSRSTDGRAIKMTGISIDITYLKQIEDELRDSRKMLRLIIDTIPIGVFWKDINHAYLGCNIVFAKELGLNSPDDVIGKTDRELIFKEQADNFISSDKLVFETGKPKINYEEIHTLPSGEEQILRKSKVPLTNDKGNVIGVLSTYEDITEQKKLADELLKMRKLESVGILAAGLAHDFNNLLMGLSGILSLIGLSKELSDKNRQWLEKAESLCMSASELTSRLITFSKGGKPVFTEVNIEKILNEAANYIPENTGISLEINTDKVFRHLFLDEKQMKQVVRNIIINSVESMPDGGVIKINSGEAELGSENSLNLQAGKYLTLVFSDTGKGIKPEDIGKVFDPYFSTKNMGPVKGQGLGLPICHSIIRNHNGSISVESAPGAGTTITIFLPWTAD